MEISQSGMVWVVLESDTPDQSDGSSEREVWGPGTERGAHEEAEKRLSLANGGPPYYYATLVPAHLRDAQQSNPPPRAGA
jgi:hypothetical protein